MSIRYVWLIVLVVVSTSCQEPTEPEGPVAPVSVELTNTPVPSEFRDLWIMVEAVYLQRHDVDGVEGREYLLQGATSGVNLAVNPGITLVLASRSDVPAERYSGLSLVVSATCVVMETEESFSSSPTLPLCGHDHAGPVHLSHGDVAVGEVQFDLQLEEGEPVTLNLMLDAGDSFGRTAEGWLFVPRLHSSTYQHAGIGFP